MTTKEAVEQSAYATRVYKQLWLIADLVFYTANALLSQRSSTYEILIFACLDVFLLLAKDEKDKLRLFHGLPKVFLLHWKNNLLLTAFSVLVLVLQGLQSETPALICFFLAITGSIFAASTGVTRITAASFVVGIAAAYMYIWENVEPAVKKPEEDSSENDGDPNDDQVLKDHAIAQDLVSKLKRLKVAMIMDKEKSRKFYHLYKGKLSLKSATRCRSVGQTYPRDRRLKAKTTVTRT
jgi:hypothetical protein